MKSFLIVLFSINSLCAFSQELTLNEKKGIYEFSETNNNTDNNFSVNRFYNSMKDLNYNSLIKSDKEVKGENFFSKKIFGSAMEVHYNAIVKFKDNKYKIVLNSFRIKDVRYGTMPIEELKKRSRKKWIKLINERLPKIVENLKLKEEW